MSEQAGSQSGSRTVAAFKRAQQDARVYSSNLKLASYQGKAPARSGMMPDASGQVRCPFCSKAFRYSQALLNRQIRCNGCHAVFRVAEDHRSFRIQPAPPQDHASEAGTVSQLARVAIKTANSNLNQAAEAVLRSLERQQEHPRPASRPAVPVAATGAGDDTRRILRKAAKPGDGRRGAVLTGSGVAAGRRRRLALIALAAVIVLSVLAAWSFRGDPRRAALDAYQAPDHLGEGWAERWAGLRRRSLGDVPPLVGLEHARLSPVISIDTAPLGKAVTGMKALRRGAFWVESGRADEAEVLLRKSEPGGDVAGFLARCRQAGITVRTGAQTLELAQAGLGGDGAEAIRLLLAAPTVRNRGFDPIDLLGEGQPPSSLALCSFEGGDGQLLQASGPPRQLAYRGRLLRATGRGWPGRWMVLALEPAP